MDLQVRLKCREMCGIAEKLSASQETLCSLKLVKGKEVRLGMCFVTLKDRKRSMSGKNDHNALWY